MKEIEQQTDQAENVMTSSQSIQTAENLTKSLKKMMTSTKYTLEELKIEKIFLKNKEVKIQLDADKEPKNLNKIQKTGNFEVQEFAAHAQFRPHVLPKRLNVRFSSKIPNLNQKFRNSQSSSKKDFSQDVSDYEDQNKFELDKEFDEKISLVDWKTKSEPDLNKNKNEMNFTEVLFGDKEARKKFQNLKFEEKSEMMRELFSDIKGNLEKSEIGKKVLKTPIGIETVGSHDNIIESTITNELLKDIILPGSTMTSSAIEAINNVDNLQRELIETEERAQKAEMRMIEMEEELIKNRETIRKLQKQLGVLSENSQKKIILEKPKLDEVIEIPETNIKDSDIEAEDSEKTKRKNSTKKEPIKKRRTSSVSKKRKTSKK